MSLQTFKKKGIINYGSNRSGKSPGGTWLSQGPFGHQNSIFLAATNGEGFSINGGTRNVGYIGKSMAMSKNGTPYYGIFPRGSGGIRGTYPNPEPVFNLPAVRCITEGSQAQFIKPSVLSTKGMLTKKYRWAYNGQYPNYWVQPVYPNGTQSDNASQLVYIQKKAAANITVNDTNKPDKYVDYRIRCGPTGCSKTNAKYNSFANITSNVGYTKLLGIPQDASQYTLQIQRKCANPVGVLKPFPFATNGGTGNGATYYTPPAVPQVYYTTPPAWYWTDDVDTCTN